jgi:5-(carboxyamino)imidazole ribonucleotide mutase
MKKLVGIIMGSDSDMPIMNKAIEVFQEFEIGFEIKILSAHRTPDEHSDYSKTAEQRGLKVIIAAAGGAAHLPGVTAAHTILPIIGVPINSKLNGIDSLLSIVQMPSGIPVATVAVDGAKNSALLAIEILALSDKKIREKLIIFRENQRKESYSKNEKLNK